MPRPTPPAAARLRRRIARSARVAAAVSIVTAAIAVGMIVRGPPHGQVPMLIAAALAIGLAVLLVTAAMTLTFLRHHGGRGDEAATPPYESHDQ